MYFFTKEELEEMLGYSLKELDVTNNGDNEQIKVTKEDLFLLFERVREQTWVDAQEQLMEWGN